MLGRSGTEASAMSIIPLHIQRRFDERWAARFGSLAIPAVPKYIGLKARRATHAHGQRKTRGVESGASPTRWPRRLTASVKSSTRVRALLRFNQVGRQGL